MGSRQPLEPNADRGLIMRVSESWGAGRSSVRASLGNPKSKLGLRRRLRPRHTSLGYDAGFMTRLKASALEGV